MTTSYEMFDLDRHYNMIAAWFAEWNYPILPRDLLPTKGVVVSLDGNIPSGYCGYLTDDKFCYLEGLIVVKGATEEDKGQIIPAIISAIRERAALRGAKLLNYSTNNPKLLWRFIGMGFTAGDTGLTNIAREV